MTLPISNRDTRKNANFEIESARRQLQLYSQNYLAYQRLSRGGMLAYIDMNLRLYRNLIDLMNKRSEAAEYVLDNI